MGRYKRVMIRYIESLIKLYFVYLNIINFIGFFGGRKWMNWFFYKMFLSLC